MTLIAGTKLGRYEIRAKIGAGGMGEVYRARDDKLNREVAIKVLRAEYSQDQTRLHRFEQEGSPRNWPQIIQPDRIAVNLKPMRRRPTT